MSKTATVLGLAGVHMGILGLIIAAGSPTVTREFGNALWGGLFAWMIGLAFLAGAYITAIRPSE